MPKRIRKKKFQHWPAPPEAYGKPRTAADNAAFNSILSATTTPLKLAVWRAATLWQPDAEDGKPRKGPLYFDGKAKSLCRVENENCKAANVNSPETAMDAMRFIAAAPPDGPQVIMAFYPAAALFRSFDIDGATLEESNAIADILVERFGPPLCRLNSMSRGVHLHYKGGPRSECGFQDVSIEEGRVKAVRLKKRNWLAISDPKKFVEEIDANWNSAAPFKSSIAPVSGFVCVSGTGGIDAATVNIPDAELPESLRRLPAGEREPSFKRAIIHGFRNNGEDFEALFSAYESAWLDSGKSESLRDPHWENWKKIGLRMATGAAPGSIDFETRKALRLQERELGVAEDSIFGEAPDGIVQISPDYTSEDLRLVLEHLASGPEEVDFAYDMRLRCAVVKSRGKWRRLDDSLENAFWDRATLYSQIGKVGKDGEVIYTSAKWPAERARRALDGYLNSGGKRVDRFHNWLESLRWDGKRYLEFFAENVLRCHDDSESVMDYYRWAAAYPFYLAAARALHGRYEGRYLIIYCGPQGGGKTSIIPYFFPAGEDMRDRWAGSNFSIRRAIEDSSYVAHATEGVVFTELAEMHGARKADRENVKEFLTRIDDSARLKYGRHRTEINRLWVGIGTTNPGSFLHNDPTGYSRFRIIHVGCNVGNFANRDYLEREDGYNRKQLWAEAYHKAKTLPRAEFDKLLLGEAHMGVAESIAKESADQDILIDNYCKLLEKYGWAQLDGMTLTGWAIHLELIPPPIDGDNEGRAKTLSHQERFRVAGFLAEMKYECKRRAATETLDPHSGNGQRRRYYLTPEGQSVADALIVANYPTPETGIPF